MRSPAVDELDPLRLNTAQMDAWRRLTATAIEPNPFFDPAVLIPAARHLPGGDRVRLGVAHEHDRWLACVPITRERRWRRIPLPCAVGWQHLYAFLGTPLLCGEAPERAAEGLRSVGNHRRSRTFLALDQVRADGPVAELLRAAHSETIWELYPAQRAAVRRRPQNDYVDSHRSGKRRREAARVRRRLAADLGTDPSVRGRGASAATIERFLRLEAAGWKGQSETALASNPEHAAFFRAIAAITEPTLRSELLELGTTDRVAAMLFNFVTHESVYSVKLAYDEQLQAGAPGVQLMTDAVDWFHDQTDAAHYDSCASPDNAMINALWPDRRVTTSFVLTGSGTVSGTVGRTALRAFTATHDRRAARGSS